MNKTYLKLTGIALVIIICFGSFYKIRQLNQTKSVQRFNKELEGKDPGWYEQWFDMRKDAEGKIPSGLNSKWYQHDQNQIQQRLRFPIKRPVTLLKNTTEMGPFSVGGRTRALCVDVSDTNHYLAGGATGGLWNSFDRGATWEPVNDAASNLSVTSIVQDPFDSNVYYYGTGEYGKTAEGYAGEGVFKSTDGGLTFDQLSASGYFETYTIWDVAMSRQFPDVVYVGTQGGGLRRSTDGGATFQGVPEFLFKTINDIEALPNGDIIVAVHEDGIYRSEYVTGMNGSINLPFTKLSGTGLPNYATVPNKFTRIEMAYCEGSPNVIYAMYAQEADYLLGENSLRSIYRSNNGGDSWDPVNIPVQVFSHGWYCMMVGVNPNDPENVIIGMNYRSLGGDDYAMISSNGGTSWTTLNTGHADHHALINIPGSDHYLVGNDGGVYRLRWSGAGREDLNDGYRVTQFYGGNYAPEGIASIAGSQDNGTFYNGSGPFESVVGGDGGFAAISLQDPETGYCEYQYGNLFRVENLSTSMNTYEISNYLFPSFPGQLEGVARREWINFLAPFEINRTDGDQLYFANKRDLFRTTNQGSNWTALSSLQSNKRIYAVGVTEELNPTVYFGGADGGLRRINNAATASPGSGTNLDATLPVEVSNDVISCITPHKTDQRIIYVTFSTISNESRVFRVVNAHTNSPTWEDISGNLPEGLPVNWIEVCPGQYNKLFVATDFGLYSTADGGSNWVKETSIPNVHINNIRLRRSDGKLFIYTFGRGYWVADTENPYAGLPYSTDFNNQSNVDRFWSLHATNYSGRASVTSGPGMLNSTEKLLLFDNTVPSLPTINSARLHVNLEGETDVRLTYRWREYNDEQHYTDGVYLSDDSGATFVKVASLGAPINGTNWNNVDLNLSNLAANHGLTMSSKFVIKFQQIDDMDAYSVHLSDGIAIDDVEVFSTAISLKQENDEQNDLTTLTEESVRIYPNPVKELLYLQLGEEFAGNDVELTLLNSTGAVVYRKKETGKTNMNLRMADLHPGTYLLQVRSAKNVIRQKVVKR